MKLLFYIIYAGAEKEILYKILIGFLRCITTIQFLDNVLKFLNYVSYERVLMQNKYCT